MLEPGAIVVLHLLGPAEKYFGILHSIGPAGIILRGINLSSFDDWMRAVAHDDENVVGPNTVFFPLARIERLFLDEPVGMIESLGQIFERRLGKSVHAYLEGDVSSDDQVTH